MGIIFSIIGQKEEHCTLNISYPEPNYASLVIINNKIIYKLWHNCSSYREKFHCFMDSGKNESNIDSLASNLLELCPSVLARSVEM